MKTLKLLIALCIVAGFSVATANAQVEKGKGSTTWHFDGLLLDDCVGEPLTGDIEYDTFTLWKEYPAVWLKWQDRYRGTFVGDITGAVYSFIEVDLHRHLINPNTVTFTDNFHFQIIRRGEGLIGTGHLLFHFTWNMTQNDFTSYVEMIQYECK